MYKIKIIVFILALQWLSRSVYGQEILIDENFDGDLIVPAAVEISKAITLKNATVTTQKTLTIKNGPLVLENVTIKCKTLVLDLAKIQIKGIVKIDCKELILKNDLDIVLDENKSELLVIGKNSKDSGTKKITLKGNKQAVRFVRK